MRFAAAVVLAIGGAQMAYAQSSTDEFQSLVELSARRLALAERVARVKWVSHVPVEDAFRESQVIASAIEDGRSVGLDTTATASFFRAQVEANKLVQYALFAEWYRGGTAPNHEPVDALIAIRQRLDTLQVALIRQLSETATIRQSATCPADVANAAVRYLISHRQHADPLFALALDRALAATCTG